MKMLEESNCTQAQRRNEGKGYRGGRPASTAMYALRGLDRSVRLIGSHHLPVNSQTAVAFLQLALPTKLMASLSSKKK
jgi:hypothetical protein